MSSIDRINGRPDRDPSIRIVRPVMDFPLDFHEQLQSEMQQAGLSRSKAHLLLSSHSFVPIIGAGEIGNLFELLELEPSERALGKLARYLDDEIPGSFDDPVSIDLKPFDEAHSIVPRDKHRPDGHQIARCVFRSPSSERLQDERRVAQQLIYDYFDEYFEVDESLKDELEETVWTNMDAATIGITRVRGTTAINKALTILNQNDVLSKPLGLDGVIIEDV